MQPCEFNASWRYEARDCPWGIIRRGVPVPVSCKPELELELIQTQMTQKPMLREEVGMRVRCANKASAE